MPLTFLNKARHLYCNNFNSFSCYVNTLLDSFLNDTLFSVEDYLNSRIMLHIYLLQNTFRNFMPGVCDWGKTKVHVN